MNLKKGFTLLEVLLSVAVMSTGVLTVVILYSLGFRETRQSREDIASAAYADAVMSPLVNALSATNIAWTAFDAIEDSPRNGDKRGWAAYYDGNWRPVSNPNSQAKAAVDAVGSATGSSGVSLPNLEDSSIRAGLNAVGVVVSHEEGSAVVKIGFRAARNARTLMAAPLYYTEVHFQGDPEK